MGGVAAEFGGGTRLAEDGMFGKVGEDDDERGGGVERRVVFESSLADRYGVEAGDGAVGAINIELTLVEVP